MLFTAPVLDIDEERCLEEIRDLRERLRGQIAGVRLWHGMLRKVTFARNIRGSNSIEGYNVTLEDAVAAAEGEEPLEAEGATWAAVTGYRDAMTYILQLADDPTFNYSPELVKSLHYMMMKHELGKSPGRWRPGVIYVRREPSGEIVYEGPDYQQVPDLVDELIAELESNEDSSPVVRAAMAHLNLVMIHPFRDGNGRMARALQTLVLSREGILTPEFSSIEEYLGRNTEEYYEVLAEVGQGSWQPRHDARPWIRFNLTAHYRQAHTLLRRVQESELLWTLVEEELEKRDLPERAVIPLFFASPGRRLKNALYRSMAEVNSSTAGRDLNALVEAGLLEAHGEKRGRFYLPSDPLRAFHRRVRATVTSHESEDPFQRDAA